MDDLCPDCGAELRFIDTPAVSAQPVNAAQLAECPAPDCGQRFERPAPSMPWRPFA
jgi:hypothetical protein